MFLKWTLKLKIENELYSRFKQYFNNTLVLVAAGGHGKLVKALIIMIIIHWLSFCLSGTISNGIRK